MRSLHRAACILLLIISGCLNHRGADGPARSEYAGEEGRLIKTLSDEDVDDLLNGRGWGFAKAAELNGLPGPLHVLELREQLGLDTAQIAQIKDIQTKMKENAVSFGRAFVEVEKEINDRFARKEMDAVTLRTLLDSSASLRGELAFVHLDAHLKTAPLLSPEQVSAYSRLRGYEAGDPCGSVPVGHDPDQWKKHNGCE